MDELFCFVFFFLFLILALPVGAASAFQIIISPPRRRFQSVDESFAKAKGHFDGGGGLSRVSERIDDSMFLFLVRRGYANVDGVVLKDDRSEET
jgi:hypothetical protein